MKRFATKQSSKDSLVRKNFRTHTNSILGVKVLPQYSSSNIELQRKPTCPCGGGCPRCKDNLSIQPKLTISEPGDKYEQEADRVADEIMRMSDNKVKDISHVNTYIQRKCNSCASGGELCPECGEEEKGLIQRNLQNDNEVNDTSVPDSFVKNLSPGQPLDPYTRAFFEPRFGTDFSNVRVHTDSELNESTQSVNARAYTIGRDVVFGAGQYAPETESGKKLIAHELTHVVQQSAPELSHRGLAYAKISAAEKRVMRAPYEGCERDITGVDNSDEIIDRARSYAVFMLTRARAALSPMSSRTIRLLDRHFHCPSSSSIRHIMTTLAAIQSKLPELSIRCVSDSYDFCREFTRASFHSDGTVELCPLFFSSEGSDERRGATFIFGAGALEGLSPSCMMRESCYDDFTVPSSTMIDNYYSYGRFAVEASGHAVRQPATIPCRPLNTGINVIVPREAVRDPSAIRRLTGFERIPEGAIILPVFRDRGNKSFIYHSELPGARAYLPGERERYYFPEGWTP